MRLSRLFILLLLLGLIAAGCLGPTPRPVTSIQTPHTSLESLPATPTNFQPLLLTATDTVSPVPTVTLPPPTITPTPIRLTTILFTGVIVPARCVQAAIDAKNDADYIYAEVRDIIQQADLAVGTLNATMSDYPPHTGCKSTYVLVGDSRNADALRARRL